MVDEPTPICCGAPMLPLTAMDGWWCPGCGRLVEKEPEEPEPPEDA